MTEDEAVKKYEEMGLVISREVDKPGNAYEPHSHQKVYLFTLKGSVKIKLDNQDWQTLKPGQELIIGDNQLHEAVVGSEGWEYIHATNKQP